MSVTIYDVAKKAGVGIATVSRVLNNHPSVSDSKRQQVLEAIKELDYQPSSMARNLARGDTLTIGVICPFFTEAWYTNRIAGIQEILIPTNYDLVVFAITTPEQARLNLKSMSKFKFVSGMIIISLGVSDDDARRFKEWEVPVVLLDNYHRNLPCVTIDNVNGGYKATKHLIDLGHEKIAYISGKLTNDFRFISDLDRYNGYREALRKAGIPFEPAYHRDDAYEAETGYQMTKQLLELPDPPTAIFAANDVIAIGVFKCIQDSGRRIPDDISVVGHDDNSMANYLNLTTVSQDFFKSGQMAMELLLDILNKETTQIQNTILNGELVIRNTTKSPPGH